MFGSQPPATPPPTPSAPPPTGPAADRARRLAASADSTLAFILLIERAAQRIAEPETTPAIPPEQPLRPLTQTDLAQILATLVKAHTTLARSLRQTTALEAKLEAFTAAGPLAALDAEARRARLRKTLIRRVENAIETNAHPDSRENLLHEFYERLEDPDLALDLDLDLLAEGPQPVAADACRDLGIIAAALSFPRRTPEALTRLLARAAARPP